jgi:polyisoprenoid-binding protein YceI
VIVGAAAAIPSLGHGAEAETYALDPVHTRVMFAVGHAGFSSAIGTVPGSTGMLVFDRSDWRSARLDVRVPLARLELGDAKWNAAALATNLLDGERHPEAHFVSGQVEPVDADHAKVCGQLTLRGVSRPLCMDVTLNALKRHPMPPFRRTAGFSATATLSRSDYGITAWKSVIGDAVELRIEAEAVRSNNVESDATETEFPPETDSVEPASPGPTSDPSTPAFPEPVADPAP